MERSTEDEKIADAFRAIAVNSLVNCYAAERVAFGFEKVGEPAPVELYIEHLGLDALSSKSGADVCGVYIDEFRHISAEQDRAEYVRDVFVSQMEGIFVYAPKDARLQRDGEELPLKPRLREYLFGLLPLFSDILDADAEYTPFDVIPPASNALEYSKWQRFVTAILLKPLKSGGRINRYVKDFTAPPLYVGKLIEKRGGNYYLKTADIHSRDYIFALFSLMRFLNAENGRVLELK